LKSVDKLWHVTITSDTHSHDLDPSDFQGNATYQRWLQAGHAEPIEQAVERLCQLWMMTSRQIAYSLSGALLVEDPELPIPEGGAPLEAQDRDIIDRVRHLKVPITAQDVLNIQQRLRSRKYNSFSSTKIFLDLERYKNDHGIEYFVDWDPDFAGPGKRSRRVFWTFKWCLEMWLANPEVLLFDNTFKVDLKPISSLPTPFDSQANSQTGQQIQHAPPRYY
jgi:hypothetical protein